VASSGGQATNFNVQSNYIDITLDNLSSVTFTTTVGGQFLKIIKQSGSNDYTVSPSCPTTTVTLTGTGAAVILRLEVLTTDACTPIPTPTPTPTPTQAPSGGGGGGGGVNSLLIINTPVASVPGLPNTGQIIPGLPNTGNTTPTCAPYMTKYIKLGDINDPAEVEKLQTFLINYEGFSNLSVTGIYSQADYDAVLQFQTKYGQDILTPWGFTAPTGYVQRTTVAEINKIYCATTPIIPTTLTSTCKFADINCDGPVDEYDFSVMMSQWSQTGAGLSADLNHDGVVDEYDFAILMAYWGS
jgi:hypothetical protein